MLKDGIVLCTSNIHTGLCRQRRAISVRVDSLHCHDAVLKVECRKSVHPSDVKRGSLLYADYRRIVHYAMRVDKERF